MATGSWSREGEGEGGGKGEEDKKKKEQPREWGMRRKLCRLSISPFHNHKTKLYNAKDFSCSLFVLQACTTYAKNGTSFFFVCFLSDVDYRLCVVATFGLNSNEK